MVKVSKFMSKVLRHAPESVGLTLDEAGWVEVDRFLEASAAHGVRFTRQELEEVVANNDKQRFALDEDEGRWWIRANQGHTVEVELGLPEATPPARLFHGTHPNALRVILAEGLKRMQRHHVHLSKDVQTAIKVGARRGRPVLLSVDAAQMSQDGVKFYVSANGVWLVDEVPARYLSVLPDA
jgi:putative RNA 2'-phosphotransferase